MKWKLYFLRIRQHNERNRQRSWKGTESKKGDNKVMKEECYSMELKPSKTKSWHKSIHTDYKGPQSPGKITLRQSISVIKTQLLQCHLSACFGSNLCSPGWKTVVSGVTTGKTFSQKTLVILTLCLMLCVCVIYYVCFNN